MISKEEAMKLAKAWYLGLPTEKTKQMIELWQSAGLVEPDENHSHYVNGDDIMSMVRCTHGSREDKCENYKPKPDPKPMSKLAEALETEKSLWDYYPDGNLTRGVYSVDSVRKVLGAYKSVIKQYQEIAWQVEQKIKNVYDYRADIIDLLKQITEDK